MRKIEDEKNEIKEGFQEEKPKEKKENHDKDEKDERPGKGSGDGRGIIKDYFKRKLWF